MSTTKVKLKACDIDVDILVPTNKDIERAEGLAWQKSTSFGNGSPFESSATSMAKLIQDNEKLVRRTKAVVQRWGTFDYTGFSNGEPQIQNVWKPFRKALVKAGFTGEQIQRIANFNKFKH